MSESSFETTYSTLLEAADTFRGGDSQSDSGAAHEVIDFDVRPEGPAALYHSPEAQRIRADGITPETHSAVLTLVNAHNLLDLIYDIRSQIQTLPEDRRGVIERTAEAADAVVREAYSAATQRVMAGPSFEELFGLVTHQSADVSDLKEPRAVVAGLLRRAGFTDVTDRTLLETVDQWKGSQALLSPDAVQGHAMDVWRTVQALTRDRILGPVDFGVPEHGTHFERAPLDNLDVRAQNLERYSGFSLYQGGNLPDSKPAARGIFAVTTHEPWRPTEMDHLFAHEGFPGHHLQNVVIDLLRRAGKLGYEATMGTMGTSFHVLQEGWAQVVWEILAGGGLEQVADEFGVDLAIELALVTLRDHAKHDVSILFQLEQKSIPVIQEMLRTRYLLDPHIVAKTSRGWATDPVFGPMVGPTYLLGRQVMQKAIRDHGIPKVLAVALHTQGLVDHIAFQEKLAAA